MNILDKLEFKITEDGDSQIVDFMRLCDILQDFLYYDSDEEIIIISTESDEEYKFEINEDVEKEDIQDFFNNVLEEQELLEIMNIKIRYA